MDLYTLIILGTKCPHLFLTVQLLLCIFDYFLGHGYFVKIIMNMIDEISLDTPIIMLDRKTAEVFQAVLSLFALITKTGPYKSTSDGKSACTTN